MNPRKSSYRWHCTILGAAGHCLSRATTTSLTSHGMMAHSTAMSQCARPICITAYTVLLDAPWSRSSALIANATTIINMARESPRQDNYIQTFQLFARDFPGFFMPRSLESNNASPRIKGMLEVNSSFFNFEDAARLETTQPEVTWVVSPDSTAESA